MNATLEKPKNDLIPHLLKLSEAARYLSVSRQCVHNLIEKGELQASRINPHASSREHLRITRESLLKFYSKRFNHSLLDAIAHAAKP